jgi:pyruvate/2-oxoglutarate dehydrogenase complex dihydrolipoamide acyltransferase (E2) component
MPKPGDAITEAVLLNVLVRDGEHVDAGAPLYVLETDKVEMEVVAPCAGTVRWAAEEGGTYEVGTLLGVIE